MKITVLTLFPEMFSSLNCSILGKAQEKKLLDINIVNIRDYSTDKHKKCDDYPFGGGAGMVMMAQPIYDAFQAVKSEKTHTIFMSPSGKTLTQKRVVELSKLEDIVILCGHYEGVDQRVIDLLVDEEISIGDYVLTGGELPAMCLIDSISRFIPNVLHSDESTQEESFSNGLLEYPQYTEPFDYEGDKIPDILYSGNHTAIDKWRKKQSLKLTKEYRKDLFDSYQLNKEETKLLKELDSDEKPKWEVDAIEKGKKFIKEK